MVFNNHVFGRSELRHRNVRNGQTHEIGKYNPHENTTDIASIAANLSITDDIPTKGIHS